MCLSIILFHIRRLPFLSCIDLHATQPHSHSIFKGKNFFMAYQYMPPIYNAIVFHFINGTSIWHSCCFLVIKLIASDSIHPFFTSILHYCFAILCGIFNGLIDFQNFSLDYIECAGERTDK